MSDGFDSPPAGGSLTARWDACLEGYRRELELEGFRPRTIVGRLWIAGKLAAWGRESAILSPQSLTAAALSEYRRHRIERVNARGRRDGPLTVNLHLEGARDFLGRLARKGVVPAALLCGEMVRILERIPGDTPIHLRDRAALEVLYSTRLRRQELVDLALLDLDLEGGVVRVEEGRGGKGRVAPLGRVASEWAEKYVRSARPALLGRREDMGKLFLSKSGRPLNGNAVREIVLRWTKAAGVVKDVSPHTLRRSCATGMIRNRANPAHVKDLLGHEEFASLDAYIKLEIQDLKEAHRRFHPREQNGDDDRTSADPPLTGR